MLTLSYNGVLIPTGEVFSVRIKWVNPACFFDQVPGDVGLGIEIPVNDYTRMYFGNPHRFEKYSAASDRKFTDVDIRFGGVLLMSGTLNITNATSESYSGWLQSLVGIIGEEQREKYINDLEWKESVAFQNLWLTDDSTDEYGLKLFKNSMFWDGIGKEIKDGEETITALTKDFRDNFFCIVNALDAENPDGAKVTGSGCVVSPFLYLRYVISELLRMNNCFIDRNDMVTEGIDLSLFKNLMVYNNFNLLDATYSTQLQEVRYWDYDINDFVTNIIGVITTMGWTLGNVNYKFLVPRIKIGEFILSLQNLLNIAFVFKQNMKVDIIDRELILSGDVIDLDKYFANEWIIGEKKDLTLKFISEYDPNDSLFADEFHDLSDRRDDYIDPVDTKAELDALTGMTDGDLCLVKSTHHVWEYKWKIITENIESLFDGSDIDAYGWELASKGEQPYLYGDGDTVEEIKTGACIAHKNDLLVDEVKQKGNIARLRSLWKDYGLRIMQYSDFFHPGGLNYDGENGLIANRWKNWAAFWSTRLEVEGDFNLPLNMICYIINNITSKYKTNHGEFIIEEMEVEFGINSIGVCKIKGYKV